MSKAPSLKKNALYNFLKTFSNIAFPLITFPYVSRVLMPENIGKINFSTSFVSYFLLLATLGISTYAIRECAAVRDDRSKLDFKASQIFSINICTMLISYITMFLIFLFFKSLYPYKWLILLQSTTIFFTTIGTDWINSAMEDYKYITLRTFFFQIISLILMFAFVKGPEDYFVYVLILVLASCGGCVLNWFHVKKYCKLKFILDMGLEEHLVPIILLFVMMLSQIVFTSSDMTMLGIMRNDKEVGLYSTSYKIHTLISQIVSSMMWVVMPRLSNYFALGDYDRINLLLNKVFGMFMFFGLPIVAGTIGIADEIVMIIGGCAYVDAVPSLIFLMLSFLISLLGGGFLGNMVLIPSKNEKTFMIVCGIAAIFKLATNYLLIPYGGLNAAACTTMIASLLITIMLLITVDKRIKFKTYLKQSIIPAIGALSILAICYGVKAIYSNLWVRACASISLSVFVYGGFMVAMKNEFAIQMIGVVIAKFKR